MNNSTNSLAPFALWSAGWLLMIGFLFLISRNKGGYAAVYYILWLSVVFLIVTHYSNITNIFQQANITQGQF